MAEFHARAASRICLALALMWLPSRAGAQTVPDGIGALLRRLEQAAAAGDRAAVLALGDPAISRPSLEDFARTLTSPPPTRLVVNERDRAPIDGALQRLVVEVFSERGIEGRLGTWRVDARPGATPGEPWRIAAVSRLSGAARSPAGMASRSWLAVAN